MKEVVSDKIFARFAMQSGFLCVVRVFVGRLFWEFCVCPGINFWKRNCRCVQKLSVQIALEHAFPFLFRTFGINGVTKHLWVQIWINNHWADVWF